MRKLAVAALAASLGLVPMAAPAANASGDDAATIGRFVTPFREDGATLQTDGTMSSHNGDLSRGDNGCLLKDTGDHKDCLPAGASENVLADGTVLYWNALEGTEDFQTATIPEGGAKFRNDQSRVLAIDWANPAQSTWSTPANTTASQTPNPPRQTPLLSPVVASNDNGPTNDASLFCSDQRQLPNGTILAAGGTDYYSEPKVTDQYGVIELEGVRNARIYDPDTTSWSATGAMNYGRWYPSMVSLPSGDVFVASGVTKLLKPVYRPDQPDGKGATTTDSGDNVAQTETYHYAGEQAGTWSYNGSTGDRSLPLFPRLHLLPNGHVYYDAAGQAFNPFGQSYKEALWNVAATYDPVSKSWSDLGVPGVASAVGSQGVTEPGFRGSTFSQMLPMHPNADGTYDSASFLTAGGVVGMSPGSYLPTRSTRIDTVSTANNTETLTTSAAGPLGRGRWYSSAVTLPTGQVLAFSGADLDEVATPGQESPIRQAELFTPSTDAKTGQYDGGSWQDVAVAQRRRTYHNNAVLLPDGRVLVGGHAPIPNSYGFVQNDPSTPARETSNNFRDASFEIYEPPYLHWGVDRPVIGGDMQPSVAYGRTLEIPTQDAADVTSVVLVRNPSETHLVDADQRVVELPIVHRQGGELGVAVTDNAAALPPGPYMLFLNKTAAGKGLVPSVAKQVFVGAAVPEWARESTNYPPAVHVDHPVPHVQQPQVAPQAVAVPAAATRASVSPAAGARVSARGTDYAVRPASSNRSSDRPRGLALLLGLGLTCLAVGAGLRRRRAPARA
jgi:hypothetical protein